MLFWAESCETGVRKDQYCLWFFWRNLTNGSTRASEIRQKPVKSQDGQEWSCYKWGREKEFTWKKRRGYTGSRQRRSQLRPSLMDLKNQCQITDMQMVRFAFYFRQEHFLFPPWEIYRHLHIRKARWNKQYHCEILMTFSGFFGQILITFSRQKPFSPCISLSFLNLYGTWVHSISCNKTSLRNSHKNSTNKHLLIDSTFKIEIYLSDSLI